MKHATNKGVPPSWARALTSTPWSSSSSRRNRAISRLLRHAAVYSGVTPFAAFFAPRFAPLLFSSFSTLVCPAHTAAFAGVVPSADARETSTP